MNEFESDWISFSQSECSMLLSESESKMAVSESNLFKMSEFENGRIQDG